MSGVTDAGTLIAAAQNQPRVLEERVPKDETEAAARLAWLKARAKLKLPNIPKKQSAGKLYKYASLDDVLNHVGEMIQDGGFVWRWTTFTPTSTTLGVRCTVTHVDSGWYEQAEFIGVPVPKESSQNPMHLRGGFLTYAERYTFNAVMGIACEEGGHGRRGQGARRHAAPGPARGAAAGWAAAAAAGRAAPAGAAPERPAG